MSAGYLLNNIFPFRLGEIGRAILLDDPERSPALEVFSSILMERVFDVFGCHIHPGNAAAGDRGHFRSEADRPGVGAGCCGIGDAVPGGPLPREDWRLAGKVGGAVEIHQGVGCTESSAASGRIIGAQ